MTSHDIKLTMFVVIKSYISLLDETDKHRNAVHIQYVHQNVVRFEMRF